jgi:HPt (histidine-containing phosphotransfer) domain-containing protein
MKNNQNFEKAIDIEFLKNIIDNDIEFEKELFEIFLENARNNISKMEDAARDSDNNLWYMAAHAFKGAAASIGAFDLSKNLEYAQKHPEDNLVQKAEILRKIKEEFDLVRSFINDQLKKTQI